jgi:hypothetical protein
VEPPEEGVRGAGKAWATLKPRESERERLWEFTYY